MDSNTKGVKIVFETERSVATWESPYFDAPLEDILERFYGCCIAHGWQPITILEGLKEFAEDRLPVIAIDGESE